MKKIIKLSSILMAIILIFSCITLTTQAASGIELFVSPNGNDSNDGSIGSPFATLEAARDKIREIKKSSGLPSGGITVNLRGGAYNRLDSFTLTKEDSGTETSPITYQAYPGEFVEIIGGLSTTSDMWNLTTDEGALKRIPQEAHGKVYEIDLGKLGYTKEQIGRTQYKGIYSTGGESECGHPYQPNTPTLPVSVEVFENLEPQTIARYPNEGYIYIKRIVKNCVAYYHDTSSEDGFIIAYEDTHLDKWAGIEDARLYGFFVVDYADCTVDIKEVNTRARTIESGQPPAFGVKVADGVGGRYYGFNMLEELDIAGEYYTDLNTMKLYYYPKNDIKNTTIQLSISTKPMIDMKECEYITFKNMNVGVNRDAIFMLDHCNSCVIDGCTISNAGDRGVFIKEGVNNRVINSEVFETGYTAVEIISKECTPNLIVSNNSVINCKIHDYGRITEMSTPGVMTRGCGNYIAHNEIYNSGHFGIMMEKAVKCTIEYNDFHHCLTNTSDAGVIYWGGTFAQQGNIIRNNYFHDNGHEQVNLQAIYQDGGVGGTTVYNNIVKTLPHGIGFCSFGSNNNVYNNVFIEAERAALWIHHQTDMVGGQYHNNVYQETLNEFPFENEAWTKEFPFFAEQFYREGVEYYTPVNNIYKNNIAIDGPGDDAYTVHIENAVEYQPTLAVTKSQVNYSTNDDGSLNLDQEAIKKYIPEWEYIDIDKIGTSGTSGNPYYSETVKGDGEQIVVDQKPATKPVTGDVENKNEEENKTPQTSVNTGDAKEKIKDAVVLVIGSSNAYVKGENKKIDSQNNRVIPIIKLGRTLLPVRFIAESFGYEVGWDASTQTVTLKGNNSVVTMKIGDYFINVDGVDTAMDVPAQIVEGRTLIPLRALCEVALKKQVFWDTKGLIVVSDFGDIFNSKTDASAIDSIISELRK